MRGRAKRATALAVALTLAVAACGDDDEDTAATTAAEAEADATTTAAAGGATTAATGGATTTRAPTAATTAVGGASTSSGAATGTGAGSGWRPDTEECDEDVDAPIEGEITIGTSVPLSGGPAAAFAPVVAGLRAAIDKANAEGGVNGQQINLVVKDDQYKADLTSAAVDELLDSDGAVMITNIIGSPNNLAVRDTLNEACVPQFYNQSGLSAWGDVENYPWTTTGIPSYVTENQAFAQKIRQDFPGGARVAYFHANNEFGQENFNAFSAAIEGTNIEIVTEQTIESADANAPSSQVTSIASADPDVIVSAGLATQCPAFLTELANAGLRDRPLFGSYTCHSSVFLQAAGEPANGVYIVGFLKDAGDPQWASDPGIVEYTAQLAASAPDIPPETQAISGWTGGEATVDVLRRAAELEGGLTRANIMAAARSIDLVPSIGLPGVTFKLDGADDGYMVETLQLQQWNGAGYDAVGEPINLEGQTPPPED